MSGLEIEKEFIKYLDGRTYDKLHPIFQDLIEILFPKVKDCDVICARKYGYYAKADVVLEIKGKEKGLSIKSGFKNFVHVEKIDQFIEYLRKLEFKNIDSLLKYIY